ncbi:MAG TPA: copper-binding protein [Burkholderiaceae bacterium]|nr:copper-binding protein [Burkholderiaceae bacterium]
MMMTMKSITASLAMLVVSAAALAQASDGEVTKVDKAGARITIKHGGVKNLEMPAMTMAFRVADPKLLDSVAVGDKVRFAADKLNGNYTITSITKAP